MFSCLYRSRANRSGTKRTSTRPLGSIVTTRVGSNAGDTGRYFGLLLLLLRSATLCRRVPLIVRVTVFRLLARSATRLKLSGLLVGS